VYQAVNHYLHEYTPFVHSFDSITDIYNEEFNIDGNAIGAFMIIYLFSWRCMEDQGYKALHYLITGEKEFVPFGHQTLPIKFILNDIPTELNISMFAEFVWFIHEYRELFMEHTKDRLIEIVDWIEHICEVKRECDTDYRYELFAFCLGNLKTEIAKK
jgi:hypothetical protein